MTENLLTGVHNLNINKQNKPKNNYLAKIILVKATNNVDLETHTVNSLRLLIVISKAKKI